MRRTNTIDVLRTSVGMMFVLLFLALPIWTFAVEDRRNDVIGSILKSSSLSKTEQTEVHARAVAAIKAGVPAEDVEIIVSRSIQRGVDARTINQFLGTGISTRQQGLPVTPVLDRIEQGLSKGVPPERIAVAAQQLASKIVVAQPIVDDLIRGGVKPRQRNEREAAIEATARALEKSISVEDLKGMSAAVRDRKGSLQLYINASNTATYFAGNGISPRTSSRLVHNAVEKGYTERDLDGMVKQIANQMMRGTRAEDAAMQMERDGMRGSHGMEQDMGGRGGMGPGSGAGGPGGPGGMGGHKK